MHKRNVSAVDLRRETDSRRIRAEGSRPQSSPVFLADGDSHGLSLLRVQNSRATVTAGKKMTASSYNSTETNPYSNPSALYQKSESMLATATLADSRHARPASADSAAILGTLTSGENSHAVQTRKPLQQLCQAVEHEAVRKVIRPATSGPRLSARPSATKELSALSQKSVSVLEVSAQLHPVDVDVDDENLTVSAASQSPSIEDEPALNGRTPESEDELDGMLRKFDGLLGRLVMKSVERQGKLSDYQIPSGRSASSAEVSRFFFDKWLAANSSSSELADPLNVDLMCSLQNSIAKANLDRDVIVSQLSEMMAGIAEKKRTVTFLAENVEGVDTRLHNAPHQSSSELPEEQALSPRETKSLFHKVVAAVGLEALDVLIEEFGDSNPLLQDIKNALLPSIFEFADSVIPNNIRKISNPCISSGDSQGAVDHSMNHTTGGINGQRYTGLASWEEVGTANRKAVIELQKELSQLQTVHHQLLEEREKDRQQFEIASKEFQSISATHDSIVQHNKEMKTSLDEYKAKHRETDLNLLREREQHYYTKQKLQDVTMELRDSSINVESLIKANLTLEKKSNHLKETLDKTIKDLISTEEEFEKFKSKTALEILDLTDAIKQGADREKLAVDSMKRSLPFMLQIVRGREVVDEKAGSAHYQIGGKLSEDMMEKLYPSDNKESIPNNSKLRNGSEDKVTGKSTLSNALMENHSSNITASLFTEEGEIFLSDGITTMPLQYTEEWIKYAASELATLEDIKEILEADVAKLEKDFEKLDMDSKASIQQISDGHKREMKSVTTSFKVIQQNLLLNVNELTSQKNELETNLAATESKLAQVSSDFIRAQQIAESDSAEQKRLLHHVADRLQMVDEDNTANTNLRRRLRLDLLEVLEQRKQLIKVAGIMKDELETANLQKESLKAHMEKESRQHHSEQISSKIAHQEELDELQKTLGTRIQLLEESEAASKIQLSTLEETLRKNAEELQSRIAEINAQKETIDDSIDIITMLAECSEGLLMAAEDCKWETFIENREDLQAHLLNTHHNGYRSIQSALQSISAFISLNHSAVSEEYPTRNREKSTMDRKRFSNDKDDSNLPSHRVRRSRSNEKTISSTRSPKTVASKTTPKGKKRTKVKSQKKLTKSSFSEEDKLNFSNDSLEMENDSESESGHERSSLLSTAIYQSTLFDNNYTPVKANPQLGSHAWELLMERLVEEKEKISLLRQKLTSEKAAISGELTKFDKLFQVLQAELVRCMSEKLQKIGSTSLDVSHRGKSSVRKIKNAVIYTRRNAKAAQMNSSNQWNTEAASTQSQSDLYESTSSMMDLENCQTEESQDRSLEGDHGGASSSESANDSGNQIHARKRWLDVIRKHNTKSTQTVYNDFSKASKSSIASKLQEETAEAELFKHHPSPHLLSQPFLGYIRKHEKIYARELGLMKIAMREFHQFYDSMAAEVSRLFQSRPVLDSRSYDEWSLKLGDLQQKFDESSWLFDPNFFIKKVAQGTNNPIDVAAQARMLQSYREAAHDATTVNPKGEEVVNGLTDLIADLESRIKEKGGWRAVLFTAEGTVDLDLDVTPWRAEEQVEILQEKLNYMQYKFKLKENELKQTTESLRASIVNEPRDEKSKLLTDADDSLSCSGVEGSIPHQTDHKSVESAAKSGADRPKPESHNSNSKKYNKLKMISSELGKKARISKMLKVKKNESVPVFNAILSDSIDSEKDNDRINSIARMHLNNVSDSNNYTMCIAESDKPTDVVEQASEDESINLLPSHTEDDEHSSLENRREHEIQILRENIRDLTEIVWDAVHKLSVLLKTGLPIVTYFITHAIDVGTTVPENLRLTNSLVAADNIEEPRFLAATSKEATKAAGEREFIKTSSKLSNNGSVQNISMQKLPNTSFSPTGGKSFIDRSVHPGWRQFEQVLRRDHANQKEDIVSSLLQQSDISLVGNSVTLENSTFNYANTNERRDSVVEISIPLISTPHPPSHEVLPGILRQNGTVHESYVDRMDIESLKQTTDNAGQNLQQICHYVEKHFNSLLSSCVVHHPARSNNSSTDRLRELSVSTTKQAACTRPKTANNSFASSNKISSETTPKALLKLKKHIENSQQALKIYNSGSDHFRDTLTEKPLTIPISSGKIPRFDNK